MKEVVITDASVLTPLGSSASGFAENMFAGRSGLVDLSSITSDPRFPVGAAGLLPKSLFPEIHENLYAAEAEIILRKVLSEFKEMPTWLSVDGIVLGTNDGSPRLNDVKARDFANRESAPKHLRAENTLEILLKILAEHGQKALGPQDTLVVGTGCITGLTAILAAAQRIELGLWQRALVICNETRLRVEDFLRFHGLRALSPEKVHPDSASRPFSKNRNGFVRGEGAGALILERRSAAEQRGAKVLASIVGGGHTSDAWRLTDGREDLAGAERAIRVALAQAGLKASDVSYINAHGTSTPKNDVLETRVIKKIFGDFAYDRPVSSLKSQIGHLNYACGIVETAACLYMLERQMVAPTINFSERDPECDLHYVPNRSEPMPLRYILKNSFGFGGGNSALILRRE